jgi:hypothetical protein
MNEKMIKLLQDMKAYIEQVEELIDGECGTCRDLPELISSGEMPDIYAQVVSVLSAGESAL